MSGQVAKMKSELKHAGIILIIAVVLGIIVFVAPQAPQIPLLKISVPTLSSELHCAKVSLTEQRDGTVEVFCQDSNFHKVILYCESVKTRPAADGSSTVLCY